jgi:heme-degrading monooxygenase HmoA
MPPLPESSAEFIVIWEFEVRTNLAREFEELYGSNGGWAQLFRKSTGYLKTDLLRDTLIQNRYITIDYWKSQSDYEEFKLAFGVEYRQLDDQAERLTIAERFIGTIAPRSESNA